MQSQGTDKSVLEYRRNKRTRNALQWTQYFLVLIRQKNKFRVTHVAIATLMAEG